MQPRRSDQRGPAEKTDEQKHNQIHVALPGGEGLKGYYRLISVNNRLTAAIFYRNFSALPFLRREIGYLQEDRR